MTDRTALAASLASRLAETGMEGEMAVAIAREASTLVQFDAMGCAVGLGAIVAELTERDRDIITYSKPVSTQAPAQAPRPDNVTDMAAAARARDTADAKAQAEQIAAGLNPWTPAGWNITKQAVVMNTRPDLATQMMQAAGA